MDAVDSMSGVEFEMYVAAVFRGLGYNVAMTKTTGDFGVDLVLTKDAKRTAVQCKRALHD
jgi:restriction system protein